MIKTFKDLPLSTCVQTALETLGFQEPTEIQSKAIPLLLGCEKIDFHGQAQTGTGKTLAFGIPLLHRIDVSRKMPQALIVAPTRELAVQIRESLVKIASSMKVSIEVLFGGVSIEDQIAALKRGTHIVVGTPGRLRDHLLRKTLVMNSVKTMILDEADIMLDMGFKEEIDEILQYVPRNREIWLFSATVKAGISDIMRTHMTKPVSVRVSKEEIVGQTTKQYFCLVPARARIYVLKRIIESIPDFYGFVFCQTKILTAEVAEHLVKRGYSVGTLHGDMSQVQRNLIVKKFKNKEISLVVATDVAARGIDIPDLTHVINFSLPDDHESYIHRIGRTGRAGKEGTAITLISKSELSLLSVVQKKFSITLEPFNIPTRESIIEARLKEAECYTSHIISEPKKDFDARVLSLVQSFSQEQVKVLAASLVQEKFLGHIEADEYQFIPSSKVVLPDQLQEVFINIGSDDGVNKTDVVEYFIKTGCVQQDQIHKVRVIKRRTFIMVPRDCITSLKSAIHGKFLKGRRTYISLAPQQSENQW